MNLSLRNNLMLFLRHTLRLYYFLQDIHRLMPLVETLSISLDVRDAVAEVAVVDKHLHGIDL